MCGIFGIVSNQPLINADFKMLAEHARQRGRDSSGLLLARDKADYRVFRADYDVQKLLARTHLSGCTLALGHSRLVTNGLSDNQPVVRGDVFVIHNGIIVNHEELWSQLHLERKQEIDTEIIAAIVE